MADFNVTFNEDNKYNVTYSVDGEEFSANYTNDAFSVSFSSTDITVDFGEQGAQGPRGHQGTTYIKLFQYFATGTTPSVPTDVVWMPGTGRGTLSGANSAGWQLQVPATRPANTVLWEIEAFYDPAIHTNADTWIGPFQTGGEGPQGPEGEAGSRITRIEQVDSENITVHYFQPNTSDSDSDSFTLPRGPRGFTGGEGPQGPAGVGGADSDTIWINTNLPKGVVNDSDFALAGPGGTSQGTNTQSWGYETRATGTHAQAYGINVRSQGNNVAAIGRDLTTVGNRAGNVGADNRHYGNTGFTIGSGNRVGDSDDPAATVEVLGANNMVDSDLVTIVGSNNITSGSNIRIYGNNNNYQGSSGSIIGISNTVGDTDNQLAGVGVIGQGNNVQSTGAYVGVNNIVGRSANGAAVYGNANQINDSNAFVYGNRNTINATQAHIFGEDNRVDSDASDSIIIGDSNRSRQEDIVNIGFSNDLQMQNTVGIGRDIHVDKQGVFVGFANSAVHSDYFNGGLHNVFIGAGDSEHVAGSSTGVTANQFGNSNTAVGSFLRIGSATPAPEFAQRISNTILIGDNIVANTDGQVAIGSRITLDSDSEGEIRLGGTFFNQTSLGGGSFVTQYPTVTPGLAITRDNQLATKAYVDSNLVAGSFDLQDDVTTRAPSLADVDRFVIADQSETGDPNRYVDANEIAAFTTEAARGTFEPKFGHAIEPLSTYPAAALDVPLRAKQSSGQIRTSANLNSTTPLWGFYSELDFNIVPAADETFSAGAPSTWSNYWTGNQRYMVFNFGVTLSTAAAFALANGHVNGQDIYLVGRSSGDQAIFKLNQGAAIEGNLVYIGGQVPTLIYQNGTPGTSLEWALNIDVNGAITPITGLHDDGTRVRGSNDEWVQVDSDILANDSVFARHIDDSVRLGSDSEEIATINRRINDVQNEVDAGVGAFPIIGSHNSFVAERQFTDFDVPSDGRSIVISTYAKDSDALTTLASFIDSDVVNSRTNEATIQFGIRVFKTSPNRFVNYNVNINGLDSENQLTAVYSESNNTLTLRSNIDNINGLVTITEGGNVVAAPADEDFGPGYFTHINAYRGSDSAFVNLEGQFSGLGDPKYSYNDIFNQRIPMVFDDTDNRTPEIRMVTLGDRLSYSTDDNTLDVTASTAHDGIAQFTNGNTYEVGDVVWLSSPSNDATNNQLYRCINRVTNASAPPNENWQIISETPIVLREYGGGQTYFAGQQVVVEQHGQFFLWRAHTRIDNSPATFNPSQWDFIGGEVVQNNGSPLDGEFQITNFAGGLNATASSSGDTAIITLDPFYIDSDDSDMVVRQVDAYGKPISNGITRVSNSISRVVVYTGNETWTKVLNRTGGRISSIDYHLGSFGGSATLNTRKARKTLQRNASNQVIGTPVTL